jgi:hypothetical protein
MINLCDGDKIFCKIMLHFCNMIKKRGTNVPSSDDGVRVREEGFCYYTVHCKPETYSAVWHLLYPIKSVMKQCL